RSIRRLEALRYFGSGSPPGDRRALPWLRSFQKKHCRDFFVSLISTVPVQLTILGSGSAGNCAYVETDEARVLIDAGFSLRQIRKRLATIGRAPENLTGILVTHEHSDHVHGLVQLSEKLHIPVYCNRPTQEAF